jgi:hypothetical protein
MSLAFDLWCEHFGGLALRDGSGVSVADLMSPATKTFAHLVTIGSGWAKQGSHSVGLGARIPNDSDGGQA